MAKLTHDDVLKLARLSRLQLDDGEIDQLADQISEILQYVEQLKEVDVTSLEPTYQVTGLRNVERPDEVVPYQASPEDLLTNAPAIENGQIKVKRMLA